VRTSFDEIHFHSNRGCYWLANINDKCCEYLSVHQLSSTFSFSGQIVQTLKVSIMIYSIL